MKPTHLIERWNIDTQTKCGLSSSANIELVPTIERTSCLNCLRSIIATAQSAKLNRIPLLRKAVERERRKKGA